MLVNDCGISMQYSTAALKRHQIFLYDCVIISKICRSEYILANIGDRKRVISDD